MSREQGPRCAGMRPAAKGAGDRLRGRRVATRLAEGAK
jgi:hypothetical protein